MAIPYPRSFRARGPGREQAPEEWLPVNGSSETNRPEYLNRAIPLAELSGNDEPSGSILASPEARAPPLPLPEPGPARLPWTENRVGRVAALRLRLEGGWQDLQGAAAAAWQRESEVGNLFDLLPFGVAAGIVVFFALPAEPLLPALATAMAFLLLVVLRSTTRGAGFLVAASLASFFTGMTAAAIEARRVAHPVPVSEITGRIEGIVLDADTNRRGSARYLVRPTSIEGLEPAQLPPMVRLSAASRHVPFRPGDAISGVARLGPVSGPAMPGGFDFSFQARFEGLGMSGFFMGKPVPGPPVTTTATETAMIAVDRLRQKIGERIRASLPGETGGIATALVTGDRSGIPEEIQESLRRSGLAHVLAISGMHMVIVTITLIGVLRYLLVLIPGLVERYPVRKWAMTAGLAAATGYLLISGMEVATQRAWIMISIMLLAGLMDRRALTMRSVSVAALVILILMPSSVFSPGFQMSFAATAALVAAYRDWSIRQHGAEASAVLAPGPGQGIGMRGVRYLGGIAFTSLVAGTATAIFSAWHFHRVAPMGLFANLAAMPVVSVLVMPMALASILLMPFGMEFVALKVLGWSISVMVAISDWVNRFGLDFETGARPAMFVLSGAVLLGLLCAFQTRLRWLAVVPAGAMAWSATEPVKLPDILVSQDGRAVAAVMKGEDGRERLVVPYPGRGDFQTRIWQRAYTPGVEPVPLADGHACDRERCDFMVKGMRVSLVFDPGRIEAACAEADILVTPRLWWARCNRHGGHGPVPDLVITRTDLERLGSHAVTLEPGADGKGLRVETAIPEAMLGRSWNNRFALEKSWPAMRDESNGGDPLSQ